MMLSGADPPCLDLAAGMKPSGSYVAVPASDDEEKIVDERRRS